MEPLIQWAFGPELLAKFAQNHWIYDLVTSLFILQVMINRQTKGKNFTLSLPPEEDIDDPEVIRKRIVEPIVAIIKKERGI